jgi:hypothetical protein
MGWNPSHVKMQTIQNSKPSNRTELQVTAKGEEEGERERYRGAIDASAFVMMRFAASLI